LSKNLYEHIETTDEYFPIENFQEIAGKGYSAQVRSQVYKIGSASFTGQESKNLETAVFISKNDEFIGKFIFRNEYREGLS
ncbi:heavy metal translocating P-type ATPase, partial [Escherichia coli]|nr:heavy metal translocating P-type ATPase [Escherichia coli]